MTAEIPAWYEAEQPRKIIATIRELGDIARRLAALDHDHRFLGLADCSAHIGRMLQSQVTSGFSHGWDRMIAPSNGTCIVGQLWDQLREIRHGWMIVRMVEAGQAWDETDAAYEALGELEKITPDLGMAYSIAVAVAGSGARRAAA